MLVRYIGTLSRRVDVAQRHARLQQRFLERERAAEHEAHEIVAPQRLTSHRLVDQIAVAPDAIARHVGADVEVGAERGMRGSPASDTPSSGHGFGIALAEAQEILGTVVRQDAILPCR